MKFRHLLPCVLLVSCQALSDFGEGFKQATCDFIDPIKSAVSAATGLLGPIGAALAAPINFGLETMCKGTGLGVTIVTNPVMIPEASVELVEGTIQAFGKPFENSPDESTRDNDPPQ